MLYKLVFLILLIRLILAKKKDDDVDALPGDIKNLGFIVKHPSNNVSEITGRKGTVLDVRTIILGELDFDPHGIDKASFFTGKDREEMLKPNKERSGKLKGLALSTSNAKCTFLNKKQRNYELYFPDQTTICDVKYIAIYSVDKNFVHAYWLVEPYKKEELIVFYGGKDVKPCKQSTVKVDQIATKKCPWENPKSYIVGAGQIKSCFLLVFVAAILSFCSKNHDLY